MTADSAPTWDEIVRLAEDMVDRRTKAMVSDGLTLARWVLSEGRARQGRIVSLDLQSRLLADEVRAMRERDAKAKTEADWLRTQLAEAQRLLPGPASK